MISFSVFAFCTTLNTLMTHPLLGALIIAVTCMYAKTVRIETKTPIATNTQSKMDGIFYFEGDLVVTANSYTCTATYTCSGHKKILLTYQAYCTSSN